MNLRPLPIAGRILAIAAPEPGDYLDIAELAPEDLADRFRELARPLDGPGRLALIAEALDAARRLPAGALPDAPDPRTAWGLAAGAGPGRPAPGQPRSGVGDRRRWSMRPRRKRSSRPSTPWPTSAWK